MVGCAYSRWSESARESQRELSFAPGRPALSLWSFWIGEPRARARARGPAPVAAASAFWVAARSIAPPTATTRSAGAPMYSSTAAWPAEAAARPAGDRGASAGNVTGGAWRKCAGRACPQRDVRLLPPLSAVELRWQGARSVRASAAARGVAMVVGGSLANALARRGRTLGRGRSLWTESGSFKKCAHITPWDPIGIQVGVLNHWDRWPPEAATYSLFRPVFVFVFVFDSSCTNDRDLTDKFIYSSARPG